MQFSKEVILIGVGKKLKNNIKAITNG